MSFRSSFEGRERERKLKLSSLGHTAGAPQGGELHTVPVVLWQGLKTRLKDQLDAKT